MLLGTGRGTIRMNTNHGIRHRQKGASLVEFAIMLPLLLLLLLGIIEFGWGVAQQIDVRHKARETLRVAIVDQPVADIVARACQNDIVKGSDVTEVLMETSVAEGTAAAVTITANVQQITGFFGVFWGPTPTISSRVEGRVEQESTTFIDGQNLAPCP